MNLDSYSKIKLFLMKVIVTGSAGFIGFHLCNSLLEKGHKVLGIDNINSYYDKNLKKARLKIIQNKDKFKNFSFFKGDLQNELFLKNIFKSFEPNIVINLAAQAGVRYSLQNPSTYIQSNIVGFGNILECCKNFHIEHLIYASSSSVYGGNTKFPFSEDDPVDHPVSLYAATKRSNELMAHTYSHLYDLPTTGLRFFTVYGPWGRPDMALFIFTKSIIEGKPIDIYNHGNMIRDFTYVDDVIEGIKLLINKAPTKDESFKTFSPTSSRSWSPFRIFNIGNSNPVSLISYIEAIEKSLNLKAKKNFVDMQPGDVSKTFADTNLLEDWIKFRPSTTISNGVGKFIAWYKDYYKID